MSWLSDAEKKRQQREIEAKKAVERAIQMQEAEQRAKDEAKTQEENRINQFWQNYRQEISQVLIDLCQLLQQRYSALYETEIVEDERLLRANLNGSKRISVHVLLNPIKFYLSLEVYKRSDFIDDASWAPLWDWGKTSGSYIENISELKQVIANWYEHGHFDRI